MGSGNLSSDGNIATLTVSPLFAFGPNTASMAWGDALEPARFYALSGDLLGVNSGRALTITGVGDARFGQTFTKAQARYGCKPDAILSAAARA